MLAPVLPDELYLGGGTGIAVHFSHRVSQDLDFFYHNRAVDLEALESTISQLGPLAVMRKAPGTLNCIFSRTKVQFLHADEVSKQHQLGPVTKVAGINVASVADLLAMKLKVIAERGELRDYFDVMIIDQQSDYSVMEGLGLYLDRYGLSAEPYVLEPLVRALGYLDDVDEDRLVPLSKAEVAAYWARRQPIIIRSLGRMFGRP